MRKKLISKIKVYLSSGYAKGNHIYLPEFKIYLEEDILYLVRYSITSLTLSEEEIEINDLSHTIEYLGI